MAFTATLTRVDRAYDPTAIKLWLTYQDSDTEWTADRTLTFTFDPAQTGEQMREALIALVRQDAQRYRLQTAVYAGVSALRGQSLTITPPS